MAEAPKRPAGAPAPAPLSVLLAGSALLRAVLILWGVIQDGFMRVPYTDVDYKVFTDAARLVARGRSPFERSTYRYTPLLAYAVLPNVLVTPLWGKVLFSAADVLAGWQLWRLSRLQGATPSAGIAAAALWLCNPFTFAISTRGSCDALVAVMLLGTLLLLARGRVVEPALLYGLATHIRIYPIVYAPAIVLFLARRSIEQRRRREAAAASLDAAAAAAAAVPPPPAGPKGVVYARLPRGRNGYGDLFLHEAFLHHLSRRDPRHCFSTTWYPVYLNFLKPWPAGAAAARTQGLATGSAAAAQAFNGSSSSGAAAAAAAALDPARLAPLPQAVALLALAAGLHSDLPFCWLLQTVAFVAFNKVSTAQYFVWWLALLPAALPGLRWPAPKPLLIAAAAWAVAQLHWLLWGYLLEFEGRPVHLALWAASVVFLAANAALIAALAAAWDPPRSFLDVSLALEEGAGQEGGEKQQAAAAEARGSDKAAAAPVAARGQRVKVA